MTNMTPATTFDAAMQLVREHIAKHPVAPEALPGFIAQVHESLLKIAREAVPAGTRVRTSPPAPAMPEPAVAVADSVGEWFIVCLEDGSRHKMMRRYLMRVFGMTPREYRARWGLARDYPMTAPGYSAVKRREAEAVGLGSAANRRGRDAGRVALAA
jgi:predicted transcriptional regulator